ncbi:MAG TPA: ABC transporter ATP-binding protein, partial [Thermoguttaceae bacterium]|nr:ABC transporter ATP-binding protein [Thermoguttaceae bacterium]
MSDVVLEVVDLWKRFSRGEYYDSLRDWVPALVGRLFGRRPQPDQLGQREFWALQEVSFQVRRGEVLGIIGPNGAGKSTLLKILARILKPTRGVIRIRGRLRALIEIAAGFHPDLTGRENIYLNGTILGMRRREIQERFDEIVDFAGLGPFLDTPVKRYSSGMQARLGFAIAAHLEPEILLVDEVLAVGDAEFQRRCLGKMQSVAGQGRTVLFVSHNMAAVQALCTRAMILRAGRIQFLGPVQEAIAAYLPQPDQADQEADLSLARLPNMQPVIQRIQWFDANGQPTLHLLAGAEATLRIWYRLERPGPNPVFGVVIDTLWTGPLFVLHSAIQHGPLENLPPEGILECRLPSLPLVPGEYLLSVDVSVARTRIDCVERAVRFWVEPRDFFGTG